MNCPPPSVRHATPSEAPGTTPRGDSDESLVLDARAGLTSADVIERTLQYRLRGGPVAGSHVRMGPPRPRDGGQAESPAPARGQFGQALPKARE